MRGRDERPLAPGGSAGRAGGDLLPCVPERWKRWDFEVSGECSERMVYRAAGLEGLESRVEVLE